MNKQLETIVKQCHGKSTHNYYCDKVYGSMDKICKYNGEVIQVPVYKEGHRGYSIRYSCKLYLLQEAKNKNKK